METEKINQMYENEISFKTRNIINQEIDDLDKLIVVPAYELKIWIEWLKNQNYIIRKNNEYYEEINKNNIKEKLEIKEVIDGQEKRIKLLENKHIINLECPICFTTFEKPKQCTNHIREYRNKLRRLEEIKCQRKKEK